MTGLTDHEELQAAMFAGEAYEADRLPSEFQVGDEVSLVKLEEERSSDDPFKFVRVRICHLRELTDTEDDQNHIFTRFEAIVVSSDGGLFEQDEPLTGYVRDDRSSLLVNGDNNFQSEACQRAARKFRGEE